MGNHDHTVPIVPLVLRILDSPSTLFLMFDSVQRKHVFLCSEGLACTGHVNIIYDFIMFLCLQGLQDGSTCVDNVSSLVFRTA